MQAILQVFLKPTKILLVRGYRLNKREQNVNVFMKKVIPRSVRLKWEKYRLEVQDNRNFILWIFPTISTTTG